VQEVSGGENSLQVGRLARYSSSVVADGAAPASVCFEARSAFTHVSACMLAGPPMVIRYIRGCNGLVTSSVARTASGWSDPSSGEIRTQWNWPPFHGARFWHTPP
jgi:hypothetical protein